MTPWLPMYCQAPAVSPPQKIRPLLLQLVEHLGLGPLPDDVAVGHDHQRRLGVGFEQPDRLAGLDDEGLVLVHGLQRLDDRVVGRPVARGLAEGGVDDEIVGVLADREDVLEQPQQPSCRQPLAAAGVRAARCSRRSASLRLGVIGSRRVAGDVEPMRRSRPTDRPTDRARRRQRDDRSSARAGRRCTCPRGAGRR